MRERQVSFAGGELSPTLWGRTDLARYAVGARTLRNFLVTPHGVLRNRTGAQHVAPVPINGTDTRARLHAFNYPDSDPVLLVFIAHQLCVVRNADDPRHSFDDVVVSLYTEYTAADLGLLRFSQVGAVLTVTAAGYATIEITRDGDDFNVAYVSFEVPNFVNGTNAGAGYVQFHNPVLVQSNTFAGGSSHPPRPWTWQVTRIVRSADGRLYETAPHTLAEWSNNPGSAAYNPLALDADIALYPDWRQRIETFAKKGDLTAQDGEVIHATRLYRGRDGHMGFIGQTTATSYIDEGEDPDFSSPPPQEFNPFDNDSLAAPEYPALVEHHENRRVFAKTPTRPSFAWESALGSYSNFDEIIPANDDASLSFEATSAELHAIVALEKLLLFTAQHIIVVTGSGKGEVITPNSIASRKLRKQGASGDVAPIVVGDTVFYLSAVGVAPRALTLKEDGADDVDVALLSKHLFDGYTVVDWAYAQYPHSVLWVVRSDGALLAITYVPEQEMFAWTEHELAGDGVVEAVATRPELGEDGVYLVVNRDETRVVERFAYDNLPLRTITTEEDDGTTKTVKVPDVRYAIYLDRAVSYYGKQSTLGEIYSFTLSDGGAGAGVGETVRLTFTNQAGEGVLPTKEGYVVQIDAPDGGLPYRFLLGVRDIIAHDYPAQVLTRDATDILGTLYAGDEYYFCAASVSGLDHLEGEAVSALVDGDVVEDLVVEAGAISLGEDTYGAIIHVGLPYESDFESLAYPHEKGRQKIVERVVLELERTRGGAVGVDLDHLKAIRTRDVGDDYSTMAPKRVEPEVPVTGTWGDPAYVAFRQSEPLPCTVLGISREIKYGG